MKTRTGVVNAIYNQIPLSQAQRGASGVNGWATGDVSWLKMSNTNTGFPDDPGTPLAMTAGFDYRVAPGWLVGAAFSLAATKQTWNLGGNYRDDEFAASLYGAYLNGPVWANAIGTYGTMRYDVNRVVPIGISSVSNTGNTRGTDTSFAGEIGYNFALPLGAAPAPAMPVKAPVAPPPALVLTHGPLVGVLLQRVRVDGFRETDDYAAIGGFTALSFGDQTRNSAVSELGYQASLQWGIWQPFAKATWNHEWASIDRLVTAQLTTATAPAYSMPAVRLGRDWAQATVGTRVTMWQNVSGYAAFISQIGQDAVVNYGGQIGINVAFGVPAAPAIAKY